GWVGCERVGGGRCGRREVACARPRRVALLPPIGQENPCTMDTALPQAVAARPARHSAPSLVAAVPREHVMVDDQRIGARPEQFGQPYLCWCSFCINMIELVVLANRAAQRKSPDLRGHGLHFAPERYLALQ